MYERDREGVRVKVVLEIVEIDILIHRIVNTQMYNLKLKDKITLHQFFL